MRVCTCTCSFVTAWSPAPTRSVAAATTTPRVVVVAVVVVMVVVMVVPTSAVPGVASPGERKRRGVTVFNQRQVFLFGDSLTEFPQHVVIHVPRFTAALEEGLGMMKPCHFVVFREEVRTDRQKDRVGVCIGLHVRLGGDPVEDTEGDFQRASFIWFDLCECACLREFGK